MTDLSKPVSPPACACKEVHGFVCQFHDAPASFKFDGLDWCRFHLPLEDAEGNPSAKSKYWFDWEGDPDKEVLAFNREIYNRLAAAKAGTSANDGCADFRFVEFPDDFDFSELSKPLPNYIFNVDFSYAKFGRFANFTGASFGEYPRFTGTTFKGHAYFTHARFQGYAEFTDAVFGDDVNFNSASFMRGAYFVRSTFLAEADFKRAEFWGDAIFISATFRGDAKFDYVLFKKEARFDSAFFHSRALFAISTENNAQSDLHRISFDKAAFNDAVSFENRAFVGGVSFDGTVFEDLPSFDGCNLHSGMSFNKAKFKKTKGVDDAETEKLEGVYRAWKREMEKQRARNQQGVFFAFEMECRRHRSDVDMPERVASYCYEYLCEYGQSILRPVLWFGGMTVSMALVYFYFLWAMSSPPSGDLWGGTPDVKLVVAFSLEQVFRPFGAWTESSVGIKQNLFQQGDLLIPLLASLQSLATIGLLTLFLLALRRRFKMD